MIKKESACIVLIDVQEKLFPHIYEKDDLLKNLIILTRAALILELPLIVTEQVPEKLGDTLTSLKEIFPNNTPIISKTSFSCVGEKSFMRMFETLKKRQVILAGIESHVCIYQTARDLSALGYDVYVPFDAISSRSRSVKNVAQATMRSMGINITTIEMALFEILQEALGDKFKSIIQLVK